MYDWLNDLFGHITSFIADFTALASLIILVVLFFVLDFKFIIRAYRMIRVLCKEINIPFGIAFIVPWRLKKIDTEDKEAKYSYLKCFCEFAIFESKGEKISSKEWSRLTNKFFYEHILAEPFVLTLDSTFDLLNDKVDDLIIAYFAFLNANSKKYYHNQIKSKFVCKLRFENGFVYPASFINGLERKFSSSWTDLLIKYNYTLKNSKYHNSKQSASIIKTMLASDNQNFITSQNHTDLPLRSNELFVMYSWLMWSPSYQMNFNDNDYKIILYGTGDESNTLNLVLNNSPSSIDLWNQLKECVSKNIFGLNLSIECELMELSPFLSDNIQNFSIESLPLLNNLKNNSNDIHYLLSYVQPTQDADLRNSLILDQEDAFFSGYLWSLFGRENENNKKFDIKNSVVFFEHSNLADSTSVEYFTKCMAQKTILHFKELLGNDNDCYYNLVTCVSENFRKKYVELINKELEKEDKEFVALFKKYVDMEHSNVTINEMLENIDEEFPLNSTTFKKATTASEIAQFYATIYVQNFAPDERDSIDDLIHRTLEIKSENHHDIILAYQDNQLVGGIVYDWFKNSHCGLIEYIVVDARYRGMRIAQRLTAKALASMTHYSGKHGLNACFIEIEDPEKMEGLNAQAAIDNYRRLQLWSNTKFNRLDFNYIQPALAEGLNKLDNLMLAVNTLKSNSEYIDGEILKSFLIDFNTICNRIEDINDPDIGVKEMLDEIDAKADGKVKIIPNSLDFEKYKPAKSEDKGKKFKAIKNSIAE